MCAQQEVAQCVWTILFQNIFYQEEVIQGFRHFFRINGNETIV